jgi:hypothetical protein
MLGNCGGPAVPGSAQYFSFADQMQNTLMSGFRGANGPVRLSPPAAPIPLQTSSPSSVAIECVENCVMEDDPQPANCGLAAATCAAYPTSNVTIDTIRRWIRQPTGGVIYLLPAAGLVMLPSSAGDLLGPSADPSIDASGRIGLHPGLEIGTGLGYQIGIWTYEYSSEGTYRDGSRPLWVGSCTDSCGNVWPNQTIPGPWTWNTPQQSPASGEIRFVPVASSPLGFSFSRGFPTRPSGNRPIALPERGP